MTDQLADEQILNRFAQWLREARAEGDQISAQAGGETADVREADMPEASADEAGMDEEAAAYYYLFPNSNPFPREQEAPAELQPATAAHTISLSQLAAPEEPVPEFGMYRLVEEFTSLRHELKLQTKSARGLEDSTQTLVAALGQAIEAMRSVEPRETQAAWSAGKNLALLLAELDESIDRGRLQTERAIARLNEEPTHRILKQLDEFQAEQTWFWRWLCGARHRRLRARIDAELELSDRRALLDALLDGYRMVQKRLINALASEGVTRIVSVGRFVDPEEMIVVDVVDAEDTPPGVVFDEVRRGYTWNGRLLRNAEVRATRSADPHSYLTS